MDPTKVSVLEKGLKFTPTPSRSNSQELKEDVANFNRKLRLLEYFHDREEDEDDSLVKNKSDFVPPKHRNAALEKSYLIWKTPLLKTETSRTKKTLVSNREQRSKVYQKTIA